MAASSSQKYQYSIEACASLARARSLGSGSGAGAGSPGAGSAGVRVVSVKSMAFTSGRWQLESMLTRTDPAVCTLTNIQTACCLTQAA